MTNRLKGVWVAFERDIREDDAEPIINAIRQVRGVQAVEPSIATPEDWMARKRAQEHYREQLMDVLWPKSED